MEPSNVTKPCEKCGMTLVHVNWGGAGRVWHEEDPTVHKHRQRVHDNERCLQRRLDTAIAESARWKADFEQKSVAYAKVYEELQNLKFKVPQTSPNPVPHDDCG